jgi:hypothetical protein
MLDDELSLDEIEALEKEVPRQERTHREVSRWPDQFREDIMVAVMEGAEEIELDGRKFTIEYLQRRHTYFIKPVKGFTPLAEVSEQWLMTN